MKKEENLFLAP